MQEYTSLETSRKHTTAIRRLCDIGECGRPHEAHGLCKLHYKRMRVSGDPLKVKVRGTIHGKSKTKEYFIWSGIMQRCLNPKSPAYHHYGGRGITVCRRWRSFQNFIEDVGEAPTPKHSIDRIDNNGSYEPGNVRWATQKEQMNNTRMNRFITHKGKTMTIAQWAEHLGMKHSKLYARIQDNWSVEDALCLELGKRGILPKVNKTPTDVYISDGVVNKIAKEDK